ncbi:redoxin domain-containing protein [Kineosporia succinea]
MKIRAPRLRGRGWLNSAPLTLDDLRGRWVVLDFWTGACVNCVHVLEELRPLEDRVTVIGVHSPKFPYEATRSAVAHAVERYRVRHPVLDDADLHTWDAYAVNAWPTLVLIDQAGYVVAQVSGEGHVAELAGLIGVAGPAGPGIEDDPVAPVGAVPDVPEGLRFPGGLLALPDGRALISDTGHQRLLLGQAQIGSGVRGFEDGPAVTARFADPLGAALLPPDVAGRVGYDVVVADSGNDAIRGLRLSDLTVTTVAQGFSTPGDVAWFDGRIVVAVAGRHQLWAVDPADPVPRVFAGTAKEGLVDGPAGNAWFAQPSGLSVGDRGLWVVDAESSALRLVYRADDGTLAVSTVIGQGLFEFGPHDGTGWDARLQHPLGVQALPDGTVLIADTFNGSVRRYDPHTDQVTTLRTGLGEPSAVSVVHHQVWVADAGRHVVHHLELPDEKHRPETTLIAVRDVDPSKVTISVSFVPPPGEEVDLREGDQTWLSVSAHPPALVESVSGAGLTREIVFDAELSGGRVNGRLLVEARAASCDIKQGPGAVCHLHRRRWEVPVRLIPGTSSTIGLTL